MNTGLPSMDQVYGTQFRAWQLDSFIYALIVFGTTLPFMVEHYIPYCVAHRYHLVMTKPTNFLWRCTKLNRNVAIHGLIVHGVSRYGCVRKNAFDVDSVLVDTKPVLLSQTAIHMNRSVNDEVKPSSKSNHYWWWTCKSTKAFKCRNNPSWLSNQI